MRIGLVIYGSLDTLSGGFLYDRKLVEYLQQSGHAVEVVSLPWRRYAFHLTDNFRPALLKRLREADYDVLLQDELNHPSLFALNRRLKRDVNTSIVSIVHHLRTSEQHPAVVRPLYRWIERAFLRTVDAFIYNSHTTRGVVESLLADTPQHVVAFPSGSRFEGLSSQSIEQRANERRPLQIVFLGNLIPRKGLQTLLDALARLPGDAAQLTVIGDVTLDSRYARFIRQQIRALALGPRVELTGRVTREALASRLATADVLAVPSSYEGFGIVYLEGMAFGLPAVGTTAGAASEIITSGVDGFLVPPGDDAALAQRFQQLASDRELLLEMSLAARRRFDSHPTWNDSAARIETFLKSL